MADRTMTRGFQVRRPNAARWVAVGLILMAGIVADPSQAASAGPAAVLSLAGTAAPVAHIAIGGQPAINSPGSQHPAGTNYGYSVAISGATAVAGAPGAGRWPGAVYVFTRSRGSWHNQQTLHDPDAAAADQFGIAAAVWSGRAGTEAVVGAPGANGQEGAVYVYVLTGTSWHLQATLPESARFTEFGSQVAISGATIVVAAPNTNNDSGVVYIYTRSQGKWRKRATLTDPRRHAEDGFGDAVAMSGSNVVIGAPEESTTAGLAYVFTGSGRSWHRQATLARPAGTSDFGGSVAISGSTALIGDVAVNNQKQAAFLYTRAGRSWHLRARLIEPQIEYDFVTVAVSGTRAVVGAPVHGGNPQCGTAFEFIKSGDTWRERARVVNPGCAAFDYFGWSVALSGNTALFGAIGKNQYAGAVYVQVLP